MTPPAARPLSLARLRALPIGARIRDRHGLVWERQAVAKTNVPGWFRCCNDGTVKGSTASYGTLHGWYRPLHLVDAGEVAP